MTGTLPSDSAGFLLPERVLQWDQAKRSLLHIERDVHRIAQRMRQVTARQTVEPLRASASTRHPTMAPSQSAPPRQARQAAPTTRPPLATQTTPSVRPTLTTQAAPATRLNSPVRAALQASARPVQAAIRPAQAAAQLTRPVSPRLRVAMQSTQTTPPPRRGRDGRFIAGNGANPAHDHRAGNGPAGNGPADDEPTQSNTLLSRLAHVLGRTGANLGDINQVDPALEAANELKGLASSALQGIQTVGALGGAVLGRPKPNGNPVVKGSIPWYQRIIQQLKLSRTEASAFHQAELRRLSQLQAHTGVSGDKSGSLLGSLFGNGGGSLLKWGGLLLKRLPLIGALLAGGAGLMSLFMDDDPNKSAEDNKKQRFTSVGRGVGTLIGGAIGLVGGPIGTLIGGMVGDKVGAMVGAALAGVDWKAVGTQITGRWNDAVKWFEETLAPITQWVKDKVGVVSAMGAKVVNGLDKAGNAANEAIKSVTQVDVKDAVKSLASNAATTVKKAGTGVATGVAGAASSLIESVSASSASVLEKLPFNFRKKQTFPGVTGQTNLEQYGTYTDAEAGKIRQLKASGANTSANLKGGMPREIQEKIIAQAKANGLSPETMLTIAAMESGGNPNAVSFTGATGLYQFIGKTATGEGVKDRFDPDQNIAGGMRLAKDSIAALNAIKKPATTENIYMMHQLGPKAAQEVMASAPGARIADLSEGTRFALSKNYAGNSATVGEYLSKTQQALHARYQSVVLQSAAGSPGSDAAGSVPQVTSAATTAGPLASLPMASNSPLPVSSSLFGVSKLPKVNITPPAAPVAAPKIENSLPTNKPAPINVVVANPQAVGRDVQDRRLAHIATGGAPHE